MDGETQVRKAENDCDGQADKSLRLPISIRWALIKIGLRKNEREREWKKVVQSRLLIQVQSRRWDFALVSFFPTAWGESSTILYLASSCSLLARWDPEAELIHTSIFIVCYALYLSGSPIFSPNIEELHYHRDTQIDNFSAERRWMGEERRLEISWLKVR